jgi:ribose transport system permease protein
MTTSETGKPAAQGAPQQSFGRRLLNIPEIGAVASVVVFFVAFTVANETMAAPSTLLIMAKNASFIGLAAFAMSFMIIAGEIDLSSGATAGLAAVLAGMLIYFAGWKEAPAVLVALGACLGVGLLNSLIVLKFGMPSFFGTLATSFTLTGLMVWLLNGEFLYFEEGIEGIQWFSSPSPILNLPWSFVILVVVYIIGDLMMRFSRLGPILAAVGGNPRAAQIVGINVKLVKTLCFVFVSLICGIAGLWVMGFGNTATAGIGENWLLWVVAIAIIGGGSLRGGVGSIIGAFVGTLLIEVIRQGLNAARVQTNAQGIVVGAVLLGAAALDAMRRRAIKY